MRSYINDSRLWYIFPAGNRFDVFEMFVHESVENFKNSDTEAIAYTWIGTKIIRLGISTLG